MKSCFICVMLCSFGIVFAEDLVLNKNGISYYYMSEAENYEDAEKKCSRDDADLLTVTDSDTQDLIETLMEERAVEEMWLGATMESEDPPVWRYITGCTVCANADESNQRTVSHQGCFTDDSRNHDLNRDVTDDVEGDLTPQSCADACKKKSSRHTYAGVQGDGRDFYCFCDDEFGKHGRTTGCNEKCPGSNPDRLRCGGDERNAVYRIDGVYVEWGYNRPDNYGGHQTCAAIDTHRLNGKINDEGCWQKCNYACLLPLNECGPPGSRNPPGYHHISGDSKCLFVSDLDDDEKLNWFDARVECLELGGDLLTLESKEMRDEVYGHMTKSGQMYWIGLTSRIWSWLSGEDIIFTKWAADQPKNSQDECVLAKRSDDYRWHSTSCDTEMTYFCAKQTGTTTTSDGSGVTDESAKTDQPKSTTTTTTRRTTTTTRRGPRPTTTTTPDGGDKVTTERSGGVVGPSNPAQVKNNDDDLSTVEIVLIVLCVILVIVITVVLVVCCCFYKRSDTEGKIRPRHDARHGAHVPYTGYIGEEWGYASETGSQIDLVRGQQGSEANGHFYKERRVATQKF